MRRITIYTFLLINSVFCLSLNAQTAQDSVRLSRELTLEKEYNPTIENAIKLNQLPELREPQPPGFKVAYSNYAVPFAIQPKLTVLPAQSYLNDLGYSDKKGYVSLGVSSLLNVNGDLGYQILNSLNTFLSIHGSHRSSHSNVTYSQGEKEKQKMKLNDNSLGLDFTHDFGPMKLNAGAHYMFSAFNYYGYGPGLNTEPSHNSYTGTPMDYDRDVNQVNNLFAAEAGISSDNSDEVGFLLNFAYSLFNQKYSIYKNSDGRKENRFMIDLGVDKNVENFNFGIHASMKSNNYSSILYDFSDERETLWPDYNNRNYTTFGLNPSIKTEGDNWNLKFGGKGEFQTGGNKKVNVAPDILFRFAPSETFRLYLQASGGINDNSNYAMFYENRYVNPAFRVKDSRTPLDAMVGFSVAPASYLEFNLFGGAEIIKDEHFFSTSNYAPAFNGNASLSAQLIEPEYYDVNLFKVGGSIHYSYQELVNIQLKGVYNKWQERDDLSYKFVPYGKPSFIGDLSVSFKLKELPLLVKANYHTELDRKFSVDSKKDKPIHDMSVNATYSLNESVSVFATAHNLFFQKYDLWYGYPAQNFNIMGGLNVKF